MTPNVGTTDRLIRAVLGAFLVLLPFLAGLGGTATAILVVVGLVMLAVALTRVCPAYSILGIKTCRT